MSEILFTVLESVQWIVIDFHFVFNFCFLCFLNGVQKQQFWSCRACPSLQLRYSCASQTGLAFREVDVINNKSWEEKKEFLLN